MLRELKNYTGRSAKKSKKESDKFKGWSDDARTFFKKMATEIGEDVASGLHRKWEKLYKQICEGKKRMEEQLVIEEAGEEEEEEDDSVLYCEV